MTTQEAYEGIRAFFHKKGARLAQTKDGSCLYRVGYHASAKRRCAVGCLLPDELYDSKMDAGFSLGEGTAFSRVMDALGVERNSDTESFLRSAQGEHDNASSVSDFRKGLDEVASQFGLTVPA